MASSTGMQIGFADLRHRSHHLPLRHFVHRVDVIHPLDSVLIALMHRVHPQISGAPLRLRPAPLADGHRRRPGRLIAPSAAPDTRGSPRSRYNCATEISASRSVLRLPKVVARPLQDLLRGRPAQRLVGLIHLRQQARCPPACTAAGSDVADTAAASPPPLQVHRDQPRHLCPAQPRHLLHIAPHQSPARSASIPRTLAAAASDSPSRIPPPDSAL